MVASEAVNLFFSNVKINSVFKKMTPSESRKCHGSTVVSRRKVVHFNVIFEEDLPIFVRNEGNCCVILEIS